MYIQMGNVSQNRETIIKCLHISIIMLAKLIAENSQYTVVMSVITHVEFHIYAAFVIQGHHCMWSK